MPDFDRPVRGVLFDMDDTLFDHNFATITALERLCVEEPAFTCWPVAELRTRYSALLEELHVDVLSGRRTIPEARYERFRRLLSDATNAPVAGERPTALSAFYREAYEAAWRAVPGAIALLTALRERGIAVGIVTNNIADEQRQKMRRCGMESLVGALITSEEIGVQKPEPAIFQAALDAMDRPASECVMVGDAWATDIVGARNAGLRPIWFNWRGLESPDSAVPEFRTFEPLGDVIRLIGH
ncbi:MAG TPA: HAD family hydrolase [Vicinamibacterales bacterium]|nr:HAD family hydrolase [Vicinamibacterales bacterium]